jgi:adenylate cyclase
MWIGDDDVAEVRVPEGQGLVGTALRLGELVNVSQAYDDPRFYAQVDQDSGFMTRSALTVPIAREGKTLAVLQLLNKRAGPFDSVDERRATDLADLISSSIAAASGLAEAAV